MATGRPQKGMTRRNHHDSLSQSGNPSYGNVASAPPRTTYSGVPSPKSSTPKASAPRSLTNRNSGTSNNRAPFKSF